MDPMIVSSLLAATLSATPPTPPAAPCAGASSHAFDFWIGEWEVRRNDGQESECRGAQGCAGATDADAKLAGHSTIARVDDCALLEHWRGAAGSTGHSLNAFDAQARAWRQFWIDNTGTVLELEGGIEDGAMVMRGVSNGVRQRIVWTPLADGSVRQHWESSDDGVAWKTIFDGIYRHPAPPRGAQHEGADANGLSGGT